MVPTPKPKKFKKTRKGRLKGIAIKNIFLNWGTFGLKSQETGFLSMKEVEAARRVIIRQVKKKGTLFIRVYPNKPITKKPNEVRMGKGKGSVSHWVTTIKKNQILFELDGIPVELAKQVLKQGSAKLSLKTEVVEKRKKYIL